MYTYKHELGNFVLGLLDVDLVKRNILMMPI